MFRGWLIITVAVLLGGCPLTIFGQDAAVKKRPKIALVLSGGGARGIAHIGVLQWFEENRIPVDYVAGTSMGGLVGGMYATGRTPPEMRQIVGSIDWDDVLRGSPAYDELNFRRKQDRRQLQNEIEIGLKNGTGVSTGLNSGHKIGLILDRLTLPYSPVENFDGLPLPLRVVATDLVKGEAVVIKDGSLSTALRATMAIPGVFTPVERAGKILADGGLVNNIPTDVAKQMGAEIIIAVDIGTPLSGDRKTLESLGGVLSQTLGIALIGNDRRNLRLADIIIAPDLGAYTIFDFQAAETLYELGYKGAAEKSPVLKNFALDEAAWAAYLAERRSRIKTAVPVPQSLEVVGASANNAAEIRDKVSENVGAPVEPPKIEADLNRIWGNGRYESLGYGINRENRLRIRAREKNYGPPFFTPSIEIETSSQENVFTTLGGRFTFFDLGGYRAELRADIKFGSRTLLAAEFYKPFGNRGFFVAPRAFYDTQTRNLFEDDSRIAEYRIRRAGIGFDTGYTFRRSELRFGADFSHVSASVRIGNPLLPALEGSETRAFARYEFDGTNNAVIPTRGVRFFGEARYFFDSPGADGNFSQAETRLSAFRAVGEKNIVYFSGAGGTSFNRTASPVARFTLGGASRLSAFGRDEFLGNHYLLASGGYLREIYTLPTIIGGRVYLNGAIETGGAFDRFSRRDYYISATGGIVVVTSFGPISVGGSFGEGGRTKAYFSIGRFF